MSLDVSRVHVSPTDVCTTICFERRSGANTPREAKPGHAVNAHPRYSEHAVKRLDSRCDNATATTIECAQ